MSKRALFAIAILVAMASVAVTVIYLPMINQFLTAYKGTLW